MSGRGCACPQYVWLGKCLLGMSLVGEISVGEIFVGKCPLGMCLVEEMSFGKVSVGEMSFGEVDY